MSREWKFLAWDGTPTSKIKDATELVHGLYDELLDLRTRLSLIGNAASGLGDEDPGNPELNALARIEGYADLETPLDPWEVKALGAKR